MRYLIIYREPEMGKRKAFYTDWFSEETYSPYSDMIVVDLTRHLFTDDGEEWKEIEEDHL